MRRAILPLCVLVPLMGCGADDPTGPLPEPAVRAIVAGSGFSCALVDEAVYCWGRNDVGQLGRGVVGPYGEPAPVSGDHRFRAVAAGERNTCGLTQEGVVCWGHGQLLSAGSPALRPTLVPVPEETVATIAVGATHACLLTAAGAIWCWGANMLGQLGNGTVVSAAEVTRVAGDLVFSRVEVGGFHTCALAGSQVWCWGFNFGLALGTGAVPSVAHPLPRQAPLPFPALAVVAGSAFTCAMGASSSPWCWGLNVAGQLGRGASGAPSADAVAVDIDAPVGSLHATGMNRIDTHACALLSAGQAWCWGAAGSGRLGRPPTTTCQADGGDLECAPDPAPAAPGLAFRGLALGIDHTCGLTTAGEVHCWGSNAHGQLGTTAGGESVDPVRVHLGQ